MAWPIVWPGGAAPVATADQIALAEKQASNALRMLTLYRVGGDPITVMPCGRTCTSPRMRLNMFHPVLLETGQYANCWCDAVCSCSRVDSVSLTAPVGRIDEVKVGGVVLDPSLYHVENGNKLVRTDGLGWPPCAGQDFTVTYLNSYEVDEMGQYVGGVLATEFLKAITGDKKCRLPSSVTSITRQGVSYEVTRGMFPDGATGVPEVDAYLMQWNPHGLRSKPAVYSIDVQEPRQITWRP